METIKTENRIVVSEIKFSSLKTRWILIDLTDWLHDNMYEVGAPLKALCVCLWNEMRAVVWIALTKLDVEFNVNFTTAKMLCGIGCERSHTNEPDGELQ